jgi:hypothetical protein
MPLRVTLPDQPLHLLLLLQDLGVQPVPVEGAGVF